MDKFANINAMFNPRAIIVFGSMSPGKMGANIASRILDSGFPSEHLYAVNPKALGIEGVLGYASATEIKDTPDLAIIVSPAATVPSIIEDCGKVGIKAAVIISSGFSEANNHELEEEVKTIAAKYGIRFVGPNCAGIANTKHKLVATIEAPPMPGSIALISQSGAVGGLVMQLSNKYQLGIGKFVSYGNAADITANEFLEYLAQDNDTSVIAMYAENIPDGRTFMESLRRVTKIKPVVIIKSGRTSTGQRAAMSHTGSMAGSDKVYDAALTECGAIRADSVEQMFDICRMLDVTTTMQGNKTVIITNSGGPGVMTADKCDTVKLSVMPPSTELKAALCEFLPPHAGFSNPIDITVEGAAAEYAQTLKATLCDYDAAIIIYVGVPYMQASPIAQALASVKAEINKPVAAFFEVGSDIDEAKHILQKAGIPCFESGERAADALSKLKFYYESQQRSHTTLSPAIVTRTLNSKYHALTEPQAMRVLGMAGMPVPQFRLAVSEESALEYAHEIGFPVCMKVVSPDILHKSDVHGVILNVDSDEAVAEAFAQLQEVAHDKEFLGVVVYPMLKQGREVIIGLTRDPQFGPVIAFGMGGVYTEVFQDIALRVAPLSNETAMDMIQSIMSYPLLNGVRGADPIDFEALRDALVKFSMLPFEYPQIMEADLNPIFCYTDGIVIADARIILK